MILASKGRFDRALDRATRQARGLPWEPTIARDEFMEATTDLWEIPSESAGRVGHPAPFPVQLPERLIQLHTYSGDLVLDPFVGSGSTAVAALRTGRHYVGYDSDAEFVSAARLRLDRERDQLGRTGGAVLGPPGPSARTVARVALEEAGFAEVAPGMVVAPGIEVSFSAVDAAGRRWLFEVPGGFTTALPGLARGETLFKTVAKAALVAQVMPGLPLVVLAPALPSSTSSPARTLAALTGPGRPVTDVILLTDPGHRQRLRALAAGPGG